MVEACVSRAELVYFQCGGLNLAARRWGTPGGTPILAVHGWLDNCTSFDDLAAGLPDCDLVAVDLAGHGLSDARPHLGAYNLWTDLNDLFAIADQLGWPRFSLIGHSRGAACAFLAAGTLPARVSHLFLLDGIRPLLNEPEDAPQQLARSIESVKSSLARPRYYYASLDAAVQARTRGFVAVDLPDARVLAQNGVAEDEHGYYWCHDPKAACVSDVRLTPAQLDAFARRVSAPTYLFIATEGLLVEQSDTLLWIKQQPGVRVTDLPGNHHFHMHAQGAAIARHIWTVLGSKDS